MNTRDDLDRILSAWLDDPFTPPAPRYLPEVLEQTRHTRQRMAWASIERWLPMALVAHRQGTAPPLRSAWTIALAVLLTLAIATAALIIGSRLLGPDNPVRRNSAMIPMLQLDTTLDASTIPGLDQPFGMDIGPDGNLYVVNAGASEILVLAPDGSVVRRWGARGRGEGQFDFQFDPEGSAFGGVAVGRDGAVYVADTMNDRVQQFDGTGTFVREWGGYGAADGRFTLPFEVAVGPDGTIYVVDAGRGDIQRFSASGEYFETIGSAGARDGQMSNTGAVAVGPDGAIYNADYGNSRLQSWASDGSFRWSLGRVGEGPGDFVLPNDVSLDADGNMYVADHQRVQVFSPDRQLLSTWVAPTLPSDSLTGVEVAADGTVWVGNRADSVIYRLRTLRTSSTVSPSPAASPALTAAATAMVPTTAPSVASERIRVDRVFALPYTVELPRGWTRQWEYPGAAEVGKLGSPNNAGFVHVIIPTNAYADACRADDGPMSPPLGPGVDDLVTALLALPGFSSGPVVDVVIDGHPGKEFWLENQLDNRGCSHSPWLAQVTYDGGPDAACGATSPGRPDSECFFGPSTKFHQRIAILDVDGTRVMIHAYTFDNTGRDDLLEVDRVFDSIDFE